MKTQDEVGRKRGSALLTTMIVIITVSTLLATAIGVSMNTVYVNKRLADKMRAKLYAEAGAQKAYAIIQTNWDSRLSDAAFPQTTYGSGWFDASVVNPPGNTNIAIVYCTAMCGVASADVIVDVKNYGGSDPTDEDSSGEEVTEGEELEAYGFAIVSGGTITWNGSGTLSGGAEVHSNDALVLSGNGTLDADEVSSSVSITVSGSAVLDGNATAESITVKKDESITGTETTEDVPTVTIPTIDLEPYYNEANENGMVVSGWPVNLAERPDLQNPPGGILWVNGDLTIPASVTVTGCFIATGKIIFNGHQDKFANYPALISRDNEVEIQGQADIHGLVYTATGIVKFTGGGLLQGSIISRGGVDKAGNSCAVTYENSIPTPPVVVGTGDDSGEQPLINIGVSAWQK